MSTTRPKTAKQQEIFNYKLFWHQNYNQSAQSKAQMRTVATKPGIAKKKWKKCPRENWLRKNWPMENWEE